MKTFTVHIGGKDRPVRYTSRDAIALKKRFNKALALLIFEDVLGINEGGQFSFNADREAQIAFLHVGLAQAGFKGREDQVLDWIDAYLAEGGAIGDFLLPAVNAAFYSGTATGKSVDFEAMVKAQQEDVGGGKAEGTTETPAEP